MMSQFAGQKYLSIESYRRSGEPVRTPVWFVEDAGAIYVRTAESTGKFKRIRNNPAIRVAPCDSRGGVKGEWSDGEARVVSEDKAKEVYRLLRKKYGMVYAMLGTFMRAKDYAVLEIRLKGQ